MAISISTHLSFSKNLLSSNPLFLPKISHISIHARPPIPRKSLVIRMGGGPRTYPGGVSKWQWKRMQAKKAKQLLKARLCRERQIYEMRKRAELKAAVSDLERPWEVVEKAPTLFSVSADEQVKVLADRFQKPGGFDLWSERDGPQLFQTPDGVPSARFFPKGVVHSVKPYGKITGYGELDDGEVDSGLESENERCGNMVRNGYGSRDVEVKGKLKRSSLYNERKTKDVDALAKKNNLDSDHNIGNSSIDKGITKRNYGKFRKMGNNKRFGSSLGALDSGQVGFEGKERRPRTLADSGDPKISRSERDRTTRIKGTRALRNSDSEVYDMSLQHDGSYGFQAKNGQFDSNSKDWKASKIEAF